MTKIKKDLITKAKVKKQYAKVKAEHQKHAPPPPAIPEETTSSFTTTANPTQQETTDQPDPATGIHPSRQAMLDTSSRPRPPQQQPDNTTAQSAEGDDHQSQQNPPNDHRQRRSRNQQRRPDYYTKELAHADKAKKAAEERAAEFARRDQERQTRIAERERYRKAMDKAKTPGRDGKVKVGRESKLLLERVQRMMGGS